MNGRKLGFIQIKAMKIVLLLGGASYGIYERVRALIPLAMPADFYDSLVSKSR